MIESITNLATLILTGQFNAPMFEWMEDAPGLLPFYTLHQHPAAVIIAAVIIAAMIIARKRKEPQP